MKGELKEGLFSPQIKYACVSETRKTKMLKRDITGTRRKDGRLKNRKKETGKTTLCKKKGPVDYQRPYSLDDYIDHGLNLNQMLGGCVPCPHRKNIGGGTKQHANWKTYAERRIPLKMVLHTFQTNGNG